MELRNLVLVGWVNVELGGSASAVTMYVQGQAALSVPAYTLTWHCAFCLVDGSCRLQ